jgi:peptidoglycan hydrolase-like amidase
MNKILTFLASFLVAILFFFSAGFVFGDQAELDEINRQLNELTLAYNQSKAATAPLERELNRIKSRVAFIEADLIKKKKDIDAGYEKLEEQKELLDGKIVNYYINSYKNCQFCFLLGSSIEDLVNNLTYQQALIERDKEELIQFALTVADLEQKKANLEAENIKLADAKAKLDKIVTEAKAYQAVLSSKIAQLTAKQQQIISQRLSSLGIPRSAGTGAPACVDDRDKDPGFAPRIAFFTYGVPNRTGLNQYGADGRGRAGQGVEQILQAYYQSYELKKDYDTGINIQVQGYGTYNIEDYVKRIYEMPNSFHPEALKAQAIAARSYALAYTNNGASSICTTEQCQVFKPEPKGGAWEQAVNDTRGWVMVQGGSPVKAWYSSTHGGYIFSTSELPGWSATSWTKHATDTTTGSASGFGDLGSNAYDKDSPWFYCDWGSRTQYNKTAWLKQDEVADIVNVILLAQADSGTKEKLYQTDKPHPYGGEVWNQDRVKAELRSRGITPFNSISSVSVGADFGSGRTTSVNVSGDQGSKSFSGAEFKDWFNLRAPANIQIVGPLFNAEQR